MNKKEPMVDYYIVRIYRRQEHIAQTSQEAVDPQAPALTGMVETQTGAQQAFHDVQELWRILGRESPDENRQP